jgi:hypothetical protein
VCYWYPKFDCDLFEADDLGVGNVVALQCVPSTKSEPLLCGLANASYKSISAVPFKGTAERTF